MTRRPLIAPVAAPELAASVMPSRPCVDVITGLTRFVRAGNGFPRRASCRPLAAIPRDGKSSESGRPEGDPGPAASPNRSDHRQANVDIAARRVGIRAHLVRLLDQRLGFRAGE